MNILSFWNNLIDITRNSISSYFQPHYVYKNTIDIYDHIRLEIYAQEVLQSLLECPKKRYQQQAAFYQRFGYGIRDGYGESPLAFMQWEIRRGVLNPLDHTEKPGSPWWRAVNADLIHDTIIAELGYDHHINSALFSHPVQTWLNYIHHPSAKTWYRAHNTSIVYAYLRHIELAKQEDLIEQLFINKVLYRLLFTQSLVEGIWGPIGTIVANPKLFGIIFIDHILDHYPEYYPLTQENDPQSDQFAYISSKNPLQILDNTIIAPKLTKLYHQAQIWLQIPQLHSFIRDNHPVYPYL